MNLKKVKLIFDQLLLNMRSYWRKVIFSIPASIRGKKREKEGTRWEGSRGEGREHMKLVGGDLGGVGEWNECGQNTVYESLS